MCTLAPAVPRFTGVHFLSRFSAALAVSTMPAGNFPPCARWPLLFLASPACIFYPVSPPAWTSRRCRRAICLRLHAGLCLSSPRRRAFFFLFPASLDVSTVMAGILPPCARWPLPFFTSPACIFYPVSPPAWTSRRCRRAICLRLHAGLCLSSPRRRAFFFLFPRQLDHLDDAGGQSASVCTLVSAFLHLAGVHFLSCFSADLAVSTMPAGNLPPCARWPLPVLASPACIFLPVSPPPWTSRRCRRAICLRLHASPALPRLTGVHFSSRFPASLAVLTVMAEILPPFARWPLLVPASPACIFYPVSPSA